jgi:hypothetical protein
MLYLISANTMTPHRLFFFRTKRTAAAQRQTTQKPRVEEIGATCLLRISQATLLSWIGRT